MIELSSLREREEAAARVLAQLRAIDLPDEHPARDTLAQAIILAEEYWRVAQAATVAATDAQSKRHPDDYWSARWRT